MSFSRALRSTLRAQLLWRVLPPVLLVLFVTVLASYTLALRFANDAYDAALFDAARSLAQQIQFGPDGAASLLLPHAAQEILVSDPYDRIFYRVVGPDGATLAGDADLPVSSAPVTRDAPLAFFDAEVRGERVRVGTYGVFHAPAGVSATVLFAETLVKRARLSRRLLVTMILPLVVVTLLLAALVWHGVRRALAPLDALAFALSHRGWGDLRSVGHERVPEEVRPLIESLDDLMSRLATAHTAQQRFISEAAHQLRTPLAGLTAQIERALIARDVESIKPALTQLQFSSRRLTRLVNQLLTLTRAEPGSVPQHDLVPLDLSRLVQETCRGWVPDALAKEVDLGFSGETGTVSVVGHELLLSEMLNNLIDNALRYGAARGGAITVRLTVEPRVELVVEDEGPGIPDAERSRIFERFHRVPGSAPGGCGLGLTIVREIAGVHGAVVMMESGRSGAGAAFRVIFSASRQ